MRSLGTALRFGDRIAPLAKPGFQLQAEGKISLKKYYESKNTNSLFQAKGYNIKYENIRRKKLYQQFKK